MARKPALGAPAARKPRVAAPRLTAPPPLPRRTAGTLLQVAASKLRRVSPSKSRRLNTNAPSSSSLRNHLRPAGSHSSDSNWSSAGSRLSDGESAGHRSAELARFMFRLRPVGLGRHGRTASDDGSGVTALGSPRQYATGAAYAVDDEAAALQVGRALAA